MRLELDESVYLNFNKNQKIQLLFINIVLYNIGLIKLIFTVDFVCSRIFLFWFQPKNTVINTDLEVPKDILY